MPPLPAVEPPSEEPDSSASQPEIRRVRVAARKLRWCTGNLRGVGLGGSSLRTRVAHKRRRVIVGLSPWFFPRTTLLFSGAGGSQEAPDGHADVQV
jgi:hypothetical protein